MPLSSSLQPLPVLSLSLPGTARCTRRLPPQPHSSLYRDHRLKPGRIAVTWCPCVWCFAGTPLHSGNALGLFPTLVFRCGELGITTESSYHPKAFLTDSNHCLALGSHRQWGYAIISNWQERWVSSCELPKLFMAEQRSLSSTIGNYHAHSPPSPSFNLWFVCRWVRLCAD